MLDFIKSFLPIYIKKPLKKVRKYFLYLLGLDSRKIPLIPQYPVFEVLDNDYVLPSTLNIEFIPGRKFMLIAHRGARLESKENTIDALRLTKDIGANVVEIDIRMSSDGYLVLHHDKYLDKHNGENLYVEDLELKELSEYGVSSLNDVFSQFPDLGFILDIKFKSREFIEKLVELIVKHGIRRNVLFEGYYTYLDSHKYWRMPRLELSELLRSNDERSKNIIKMAHDDGKIVYASVMPGNIQRMKTLIELGVDGIMTADIRNLYAIVKEKNIINIK